MKRWFVLFSGALLSLVLAVAAPTTLAAQAYDGHPKLVILLVFDQFRGDYLDRYRNDFKAKNGWNLFLRQGAHFPDCYYDYANLVTAAGHATIGTGAYTDGHGIPLNEWYEAAKDGSPRQVSSVTDDRYHLVGVPAGTPTTPGTSPHNELATTLGDELVLDTRGRARVFGVSLKDRAAILTSGHASKAAFWIDHESGRWVTSNYWMEQLPDWVSRFNDGDAIARARKAANAPTGAFYDRVGRTAAGVAYQLDFTQALIDTEKLGNNPDGVTDLLTLSISSTDINGHAVGPDDPSQRQLIIDSDALLDRFFTHLDKTVGLSNILVAMTGDHGVAVSQKAGTDEHMPVLGFSATTFTKPLEAALEARYPLKGKGNYVIAMDNPYLFLNQRAFEAAGVKEKDAENTTRTLLESIFAGFRAAPRPEATGRLPEPPLLAHAYTLTEMRSGGLPDTQYGRLLAHSYSPVIGWGLHLNFGPYQFPWGGSGTTHFTANSYDRHVPLELFGAAIQPGTYHGLVAPVDIVATFASLLRINRPSAAVGQVLTQALRPGQ